MHTHRSADAHTRLRRWRARGFLAQKFVHRLVHVQVQVADEIQKPLNMGVHVALEGSVRVQHDFDGKNTVVLVILSENLCHKADHVRVNLFDLLIHGQSMEYFKDSIS